MCYNAITGFTPSYLSELPHLYGPSRSLCSSSDTRMLKFPMLQPQNPWLSHFGPNIWNNLPQDIRHSATLSSFKSKLKTFLSIFQLSNIVHHPYQSVCVCVCVCKCMSTCIFCIVMLEPLSTPNFYFIFSYIYIFISMCIMCYTVLAQRFEPQGRCFTNFHYYYYYQLSHMRTC